MNLYETALSNDVLIGYYDKYKDAYHNGYPQVKNPSALTDGINDIVHKICRGQLPKVVAIYIMENDEDRKHPENARYVIIISKGGEDSNEENNYAIKLIYQDTNEMESLSTFEESHVQWSPDTMDNTKHPLRTKYYLGFTYLICQNSPGFDIVPQAEKELTGEELIALGFEGELPPESVATPQIDNGEYENDVQRENNEVPEEDDTNINMEDPDNYDEDINDLDSDYEELFEDN